MANYFLAFTIGCGCALAVAAWSLDKKIFQNITSSQNKNLW